METYAYCADNPVCFSTQRKSTSKDHIAVFEGRKLVF